MPRARLGAGPWQFEDESLARLRDKITRGRKTLGEVCRAPLYGIKTGFNDAFVIDTPTRDRLVAQDPRSGDLLVPFVRGENIKRWRVESEGLFLVDTPKGEVDIDAYPAIRDWLLPFKPELEKRAARQEWFELQQAQLKYRESFLKGGVVLPDFSQGPKFAPMRSGHLIDCTVFLVPQPGSDLLAVLNSRLAWFVLFALSNPLRGGTWRLRLKAQYVEQVPIAAATDRQRAVLGKLGEACADSAARRVQIQERISRRILDLAAGGHAKLSRRLEEWWTLDFAAFRAEVERALRADIPVGERGEWEAYLGKRGAEVRALNAEIEKSEREIDAIVYRLFDLTPDEIALLEASMAGQY
jgi:hypothetical protein